MPSLEYHMGSRKRLKPHKVEADTPLPAQHEAQKPESRASPESSTESAVQNERTQAPEAALITDVGSTTMSIPRQNND